MPKFMQPETALARLVEDEGASVADRVRALKMLLASCTLYAPANPSPLAHRTNARAIQIVSGCGVGVCERSPSKEGAATTTYVQAATTATGTT